MTVSTGKLIRLDDVLMNIGSLDWRDGVFVPKGIHWNDLTLDTLVMILDPDDVDDSDDSDDEPLVARENNMQYALFVNDVQSICANVAMQKKTYNNMDLLNAFVFYIKNDAFLDFSKLSPPTIPSAT